MGRMLSRSAAYRVPFLSCYFPTIDYPVNLESIRIIERVPLWSQLFFIVIDSPANLEFFLQEKDRNDGHNFRVIND